MGESETLYESDAMELLTIIKIEEIANRDYILADIPQMSKIP